MKGGRSKDLVALVALLCAASYGTWLWMRSSLELGGGWTDGERVWSSVRGDRIRYAVWDDPDPMAGFEGEEGARPALSPDGRWLVFAVGERGLNMDLYLAEMVAGRPTDPRPLTVLNGPSDELAPAFAHDALYFATDRTGTGDLDLWRATYLDGSFGPPEALPRGVNTGADETDPWPLPEGGLIFSSNRPRGTRRDFDLYRATRERTASKASEEALGSGDELATDGTPESGTPESAATPEDAGKDGVLALDALNTPFDERDPSLSADGRTLVFASDRIESLGGFDLFRSVAEDGVWLDPEALSGVNGPTEERGPLLSRDGFTLYFDRAEPSPTGPPGTTRPPELWTSRSLELFRLPAPPVSWKEWAILAALVVLALLAFLAKRWTALEIIYKCFLISLIVHLLMLYFLREVYPESEPVELPGEERTFRIRLAPNADRVPSESRERAGELSAQRAVEFLEASPERRALEVARAEPANAAPSAQGRMEAPSAPTPEAPQAARPTLNASRTAPTQAQPRLEDRERIERQSGAAPALIVAARALDARPVERAVPKPNARRVAMAETTLNRPNPSLGATVGSLDLPAELDAAPQGERFEAEPAALTTPTEVAVATPDEGFAPLAEATPAPSLALPEIARATPTERGFGDGSEADAPARRTSTLVEDLAPQALGRPDAPRSASLVAGLEAPRFDAPLRPRSAALEAPRGPERLSFDVRAAEDTEATTAPQTQPAAEPKRFDALAGLRAERKREGSSGSSGLAQGTVGGPTRLSPSKSEDEAPSFSATLPGAVATLAVPDAPAAPAAEERPERIALPEDPYKNRFGDEKLRALEEFGGTEETERAVAQGLAYLASIQSERGYWGSRRDYDDKYGDVRIGKTGLALLAFLGAGHTPRSGAKHATVSERAVDFLLSQLDVKTWHFGDTSSYGHGIATYALAECYALTKDPVLERPLRGAVEHILANQAQRSDPRFKGGWGYYYDDGRTYQNDRWPRVSISSWQIMALESARLGGIQIPGSAFEDARSFLLGAWDRDLRAFRYTHSPSRLRSGYPTLPASTPAALFALSLLGLDPGAREFAEARRFVLDRAPQSYESFGEDAFVFEAQGNLYFWYYGSLALLRSGGGSWRRWNQAMKDTLLPAQQNDGSWANISTYAKFAGDDRGDRSYSTAMCVLTLEVYYRYFTPLREVK